MRSTTILVLGVLAGAMLGCRSVPLPRPTTDATTATVVPDASVFTVGPGDLLLIAVVGHPELGLPETGLRVSPDGTLSLPFLDALEVDGRTVEETRAAVEAGFAEYYHSPNVMVSVLEYTSRRFFLLGDVKDPGPYPMDRPLTALEALSFGGGFQPGANREQVVVLRRHSDGGVEVLPFNASTPGPDGLVQVLPDDLVFISRAGVGVFSDEVMPYLQGFGYSLAQIAAIAIAYDRLED